MTMPAEVNWDDVYNDDVNYETPVGVDVPIDDGGMSDDFGVNDPSKFGAAFV